MFHCHLSFRGGTSSLLATNWRSKSSAKMETFSKGQKPISWPANICKSSLSKTHMWSKTHEVAPYYAPLSSWRQCLSSTSPLGVTTAVFVSREDDWSLKCHLKGYKYQVGRLDIRLIAPWPHDELSCPFSSSPATELGHTRNDQKQLWNVDDHRMGPHCNETVGSDSLTQSKAASNSTPEMTFKWPALVFSGLKHDRNAGLCHGQRPTMFLRHQKTTPLRWALAGRVFSYFKALEYDNSSFKFHLHPTPHLQILGTEGWHASLLRSSRNRPEEIFMKHLPEQDECEKPQLTGALGGSSHLVYKWLIPMVIVSPLTEVVGPLPNGLNGLWMGVTNYLVTVMILQVPCLNLLLMVGNDGNMQKTYSPNYPPAI